MARAELELDPLVGIGDEMTEVKITRGDGWNVFLSGSRLFIVETNRGTRVADFAVDAALLATLRDALAEKTETSKKKTTRKKAAE